MCAMLLVMLICAVGGSQAAMCSNGTQSKFTLTPYDDGIVGRYLAEMCTDLEPKATAWKLSLTFFANDYSCKHAPQMGIHRPGKVHSTYEQLIELDGNCSHVCLNTTFDLIFSACYAVESSFIVNNYTRHITYSYFNIKNEYTKDLFMHNKALVDIVNHDEENLTIVWHTGVPFDNYDMKVCKILNATADIPAAAGACARPGGGCAARGALLLRCGAALPAGCWELLLTLDAPWTHGIFRDQGLVKHQYCKSRPREAAARGSSAAWAWAAAALLAAGGALAAARAAAAAAARSRQARKLHRAVLRDWRVQRSLSAAAAAVKPPRRHVVLLYAREGAAAARVTAAVRALLGAAPHAQVYDVFSPAVTAAAAAAPGAWLRALLAREDAAVVLLQTPALAALYRDELAAGAAALAEPLLGRRLRYRAPHYGDALLQLALRLAADAHAAPGAYHKYYLATLSGLPTEMFPALVPYRRYVLPAAAPLLLRDVCGAPPAPAAPAPAPAPAALEELERAAAAFAELAAERPDYLMDELLFV